MAVCKALITKGNYKFVGKNEMCAGKKKTFPTVKVWEKAGESYNLAGTEQNFYGKEDNYYFNQRECKQKFFGKEDQKV